MINGKKGFIITSLDLLTRTFLSSMGTNDINYYDPLIRRLKKEGAAEHPGMKSYENRSQQKEN